MNARPHLRTRLPALVSAWWYDGPTYDERISYLHNRSLLGMVRAVVSICAFLLGLMSFALMLGIEPLTTPIVVRLIVCGVVAVGWAVRWQVGPIPTAREAAIFVGTAIIAIYAATSAQTDPVAAALGIASLAMIATFGALILSTRAFVLNSLLVAAAIAASAPPVAAEHGALLTTIGTGILVGATIGVPATMQFGMSFSWLDTAEAGTDQLTGIPNRRGLSTRWSTWAMRRMPSAAHVGVLVLDLDRFKEINDRQGHAAGDEVLVRVARVLRVEGAADDAIVARLGGDEFALLVMGRSTPACLALGERIRRGVAALPGSGGITVTASVGVGVEEHPVVDASLLETLLARTDRAMYTAKRTGDAVVLAS